jgi:hypothetical protein
VAFFDHIFPDRKHFIPGKAAFEKNQFLSGPSYQNDGCARHPRYRQPRSPIMKSVTFSDIERAPEQARRRPLSLGAPQRAAWLGLTLALGLPALMFAFHVFDPHAPLAYIVVPILAGGLMPMAAQMMTGRFEVMTRFDACHLVVTMDEALARLGYAPAERLPGAVRYRARGGKEIAVTVREHALEVTGPVKALRALREQMAC